MADELSGSARRLAHMIDDVDMGLRCYPRGTRELGELCHMSVVINGEPVLEFDEDAGDLAPRELIVDISTASSHGSILESALATRPWAREDSPLIICADQGGTGRGGAGGASAAGICYLIRTREIAEIVEAVRDALDVHAGGGLGHVRLDAAVGGR